MGIQQELAAELKDGMKTRDKARTSVIRQIQTEVAVAKSAPGFKGEVDDALYKSTIVSYVKKMEKARVEFEGLGERGAEQAEKLAYEVEYLSRWTPSLPGEDETRKIVRSVIDELGVDDPKMMGRVMGHIMKSDVELDGGLVNRLVREELGV
ncbi:MAG: GatB/YqeY domain-containing protein [bacterium]|nr:GatB/YqeY domain-containing protein [bacterium]MCP4963843.1 GatB/YqeY domain-containing protein [bacterium]